jgi:hypothetical protein
MSEVHFEIFRQQGKSGGWSLVEALDDREAAIKRAKLMIQEGQAAAVRVVKETYTAETGDYMSLTVFEDGKVAVKKKNKKLDDVGSPSPCFKPDDLYSYHARTTMARILADWLARQRLTITELLHSASALELLEATGTTYQHAIQRIAVAQANDSDYPVTQLVKQLNELCTTAIHRVYKDEKRSLFPQLKPGEFGAFATKVGSNPNGRYVLNGAITKYLADIRQWDAKLQRMLALMQEAPEEGLGRALLLSGIDTLIAEMLNGAAALGDLLGHSADLGHALIKLVDLFLGQPVSLEEGASQGVNDLARYFAQDELPESRMAIASRILSELKGMKRLCPSSLEEEFKMQRRLGNNLVKSNGKYLEHQDLIDAFTERSRRLVTHEPLYRFLETAKTPDEKLERLLVVEENIVGAENRRTLSSFMMPIITSSSFEDQIHPGAPLTQRLRRIVEIQERILRSNFQDVQKNHIAVALDIAAQRLETRTKFLASLEIKFANPVERAQALIKLCAAGVFTQGDLMMKARRLLMASISKPGFLNAYVSQLDRERPGGVDRKQALAEWAAQLEAIGIAPEDAMRALAA